MTSVLKENPNKDRIFTVANEIDEKVGTAKEKGVVLVGLSRAGKSTCFNWIQGHPLVAKPIQDQKVEVQKQEKKEKTKPPPKYDNMGMSSSEDEDGSSPSPSKDITSSKDTISFKYHQIHYEPETIRKDTGQVKSGIKSCTLVPNIVDLDKETNLIDMPGYGDARNFVGVLGVSYSLKAVFQALKQVKFIIVVNQYILKNTQRFCDTLTHFFNMFNIQKYPDIQKPIFAATSLLITQSVEYKTYYEILKKICNQLKDPEIQNIENIELIRIFLRYITKENRYAIFQKAKLGQKAEKCTVINDLNLKGWNYFDLKAQYKQKGQANEDIGIINLPFEKEYANIGTKENRVEQQTKLMDGINRRLKSYGKFAKIFAKLYEQIFVERSIKDIRLPYENFFEKIRQFIWQNDHYDTEKRIPANSLLVPQFCKPQKETLLYLLLKIKNIVTFNGNVIGGSKLYLKPTMELFSQRFEQLVELISVIFCRNREEYKLMLQLKFILQRGVREFYMLMQVSQENVSSCVNEIHDSFQFIFPNIPYWQLFLDSFELNNEERIEFGEKNEKNTIQKYLKTRENAFALEVLFKMYQNDIVRLKSEYKDQYYQIMRDVKLIHARSEFSQMQYRKCVAYLLEALSLEKKFERNYIQRMGEQLDQSPIEIMVKTMYANQQSIFDMLKQCSLKLINYPLALQISQKMKWVHSVCEIYELILAKSNEEKYIQEYADYCMTHGLPQRGRQLFHRLLQTNKTFEKKKNILRQIKMYKDNPKIAQDAYSDFLSNYFIDLIDPAREELMVSIARSFKNDISVAADKLIEISSSFFAEYGIKFNDIQCDKILRKYLSQRDSSQSTQSTNGFTVTRLDIPPPENLPFPVIKIVNSTELAELGVKLIENIQTVSKLVKIRDRNIRVDIEKIESLDISPQRMLFTLDINQAKGTFEYADRIMKAISKMVFEPRTRLWKVVSKVREEIERANTDIKDYLRDLYGDSISFGQIGEIISLILRRKHDRNEQIEGEFRKKYKQPRLVCSELHSIFDYVRQKHWSDVYSNVKADLCLLNSTKESEGDADISRY